ncbi:BadF/BadG/BcrA/BcrD ATPase family protein [soil metagenome]
MGIDLQALAVGIDAGGSKTELLAAVPGNPPTQHFAPGVNLQRDGVERTTEVLSGLLREALEASDSSGVSRVTIGISGAGREGEQDLIAEALTEMLPAISAANISVMHDAHLAHEAAFQGKSGIVIVSGTGSIIFARTVDDEFERAGGWGSRLGDEGAGTAIGWAALRAVAAEMDGGPPTVLREWLKREHGIGSPDALIARAYAESQWPVQHLAPLVIQAAEENDWVATLILKQQANALAQQAGWLATRTDGNVEKKLALVGGLISHSVYYRECLAEALLRYLPAWRLIEPAESPAEAALRLSATAA